MSIVALKISRHLCLFASDTSGDMGHIPRTHEKEGGRRKNQKKRANDGVDRTRVEKMRIGLRPSPFDLDFDFD